MSKIASKLLATALLCGASVTVAAEIDVMTQNQYIGADLAPVLAAATADPFDFVAFNAAVVTTLTKIATTRPTERTQALAAQIRQRNPDVVGLQEAFVFTCLPYPGVPEIPGKGCDDPQVRGAFGDRLAGTVEALRGWYFEAGRATNLKIDAIPFEVNGWPAILQMADRDAILVRSGLAAQWVDFTPTAACRASDQGCNYVTRPPPISVTLGTLTLELAIERGFLAVDVAVRGRPYRVFNTHLEQRLLAPDLPETRLLQVGQAVELLTTALGTWDGVRQVVVLGDFNSDPTDTIPGAPTPYQVFAGNGFTDAWTLRPQAEAGYSCCRSEDLTNPGSALYERIDLVFSLVPPRLVLDMRLLGDTMGDKTRPPGFGGRWPSDHASVAAMLQFD